MPGYGLSSLPPPQTQALLQVRVQLHSMMTRERRHGSLGFRSRVEGGRELLRETEATGGGSGAPAALQTCQTSFKIKPVTKER